MAKDRIVQCCARIGPGSACVVKQHCISTESENLYGIKQSGCISSRLCSGQAFKVMNKTSAKQTERSSYPLVCTVVALRDAQAVDI